MCRRAPSSSAPRAPAGPRASRAPAAAPAPTLAPLRHETPRPRGGGGGGAGLPAVGGPDPERGGFATWTPAGAGSRSRACCSRPPSPQGRRGAQPAPLPTCSPSSRRHRARRTPLLALPRPPRVLGVLGPGPASALPAPHPPGLSFIPSAPPFLLLPASPEPPRAAPLQSRGGGGFFLAHSWKFRAWTVPPGPA